MSIFIVFILLAVAVYIIASLADSLYDRWKNKRTLRLFRVLSRLAEKKKLMVSSQELFHQTLIGFDGVSQKLLIVSLKENGQISEHIVDIRHLVTCTVKKESVVEGDTIRQQLLMELHLDHNSHILSIPLFKETTRNRKQCESIFQKARLWEMILQKMVHA